ncbi:hypothetical protein ABZ943_30575, partial [Streptomyces rubiginosohelvolus]|uniref:hypothetical protein n=1 Tax=Streptomyces rubiginosohelvolus TaxID=67362 RepID=UPI0034722731
GAWWRTFGILALTYLLTFLLTFLVSIPFGIIGLLGPGLVRRGHGVLRGVRAAGAGGLPGKRSHSVLQS